MNDLTCIMSSTNELSPARSASKVLLHYEEGFKMRYYKMDE